MSESTNATACVPALRRWRFLLLLWVALAGGAIGFYIYGWHIEPGWGATQVYRVRAFFDPSLRMPPEVEIYSMQREIRKLQQEVERMRKDMVRDREEALRKQGVPEREIEWLRNSPNARISPMAR